MVALSAVLHLAVVDSSSRCLTTDLMGRLSHVRKPILRTPSRKPLNKEPMSLTSVVANERHPPNPILYSQTRFVFAPITMS